MCGIFGYVGKKNNASDIVFEGLKLLEYRGYDSWGIATQVENGKLKVEKHAGKIENQTLNSAFLTLNSQLAIGHTRWATHGGVTDINAHPHLDCSSEIAVVHNGIIENYQELKSQLLKNGHTFVSQTDTEVFAHLCEEYLKKEEFTSAFRDAFNRLKGLSAIVAMYVPSKKIIAAKTGSPLVVGIGQAKPDELFIASDAIGVIKHTKKVIFLADNQMVILGNKIKLLQLPSGKEIKPKVQTLDWNFEDADKGHYKHFLIKEIYEQPRVIENIALNYQEETKNLAKIINKAFGTFMLGCGTASYAALSGTYLFSKIAKKHVNFSIGSEFKYQEDYLTPKTLVIAISQSGETIDVVEPVENAKNKGSKIVAIVNVLGSSLYRQADYKLLLNAGPEKAVVGTKSFVAMVSIILLTAYTLQKRQLVGKELLLKSSQNVRDILKDNYIQKVRKIAKTLKNKEHIYILGRGLSYAAALEGALKIKETSLIHAEGFAAGELKHGVIALIEKGTPCIVIAPNDETYNDIISNATEVKARGGVIIGIGPKDNEVFDQFIKTKDVGEATLIPQVVVCQLLAYYLALERGIADPDKPRNLAKSVTVK